MEKKIIKPHSSRKIYNNINKKREKACITNKNIIKFNNELDTTKNKSKQNHTTKSKIKKNLKINNLMLILSLIIIKIFNFRKNSFMFFKYYN